MARKSEEVSGIGAVESDVPYGKIDLSSNALTVLEKRYFRKNEQGEPIEDPEQLFLRVASAVANADRKYGVDDSGVKKTRDEFYRIMSELLFIPNSPTLMNAGTELGQLSACFVLPVEDSMEGIFEAVKNTALIHKTGGGTGFSFSRLRPKDSFVGSTGGVASGPISFIKVFDSATDVIKQGGKRRGANMGILKVEHPDVFDFITCKEREEILNNFNLSVGLNSKFMESVEKDGKFDLTEPKNGKVVRTVFAREIFDLIVDMAWKNGEPGVIFLDRINEDNPTPNIGEIEGTNPCGEQPLLSYESCNLGSINLKKMVRGGSVDYDKLREVVHLAVRFLDNVIDINKYPLPKIDKVTKDNRKIGLGVMGWADMLAYLRISYNSLEALRTGEEVMRFIQEEAYRASEGLAEEREPFPNFKGSIHDNGNGYAIRNASLTTIAPTGTISIIANTSSGIEPFYAMAYERHVMDNDVLVEVNPIFEEMIREEGIWSPSLISKVAEEHSLKDIPEIPTSLKNIFVTAHDVSPEWHIRMQAAFQKYVDNAVSKTVNFPNEATRDDVSRVYLLAHELRCKGVTIYRDGSRKQQVLTKSPCISGDRTTISEVPSSTSMIEGEEDSAVKNNYHITPRPRVVKTYGITEKIGTGCGNLYVTINEDEEGPCEIFTQMGKSGGCAASQSEAISRLISLALRSGISMRSITKQLKGIRCPAPLWHNGGMVLSCSDAISRVINDYMVSKTSQQKIESPVEPRPSSRKDILGMCPDCGNVLEYVEGCAVCRTCGFTKCG